MTTLDEVLFKLEELRNQKPRTVIAVAGPPAAGKSTLSEALTTRFGDDLKILPMDGFHLDNAVLEPRGHLPRKGAPFTFDVEGFTQLVEQIAAGREVMAPIFDRSQDRVIPAAERIAADTPLIVVEGNYLLLDDPAWAPLRQFWDLTIFLDVPMETLKSRLIERWITHNHTFEQAEARAMGNDIPNAQLVIEQSVPADITLRL